MVNGVRKIQEKIDRLLCSFISPDIAYEDQSAPLLDSSWSYTNRILSQKTENGFSLREMIEFFEKIDRETQREAVVRICGELPRHGFLDPSIYSVSIFESGYNTAQQDMGNNRWVQEI